MKQLIKAFIFASLLLAPRTAFADGAVAPAATPAALPEIEVYLPSPLLGGATDARRAAVNVQTVTEDRQSIANDLSERLADQVPSLHTGDAQNNPFQKDMSFRGYTASPLLGSAQGLAVYQNGVRANETFGDTVEWDTIPDFAADTIQLIPGANPVFGLNALGGTLALKMKDGFNFVGGRLTSQVGSFGRREVVGEYGLAAENENWATYIGSRYTADDGWRDDSPSYLRQGYGSINTKGEGYGLGLDFTYADNDLTGNGPLPSDLMAREGRRAIFTSPDITANELFMTSIGGFYEPNDDFTLRTRLYYKDRKRSTVNGDEYDSEECEDDDFNDDFNDYLCNDDDQVLITADGKPIKAEAIDGNEWGSPAALNRTNTDSEAMGITVQGEFKHEMFGGRKNFLLGGISYDHGETGYSSDSELGIFNRNRSVRALGINVFAAAECDDPANLQINGNGVLECDGGDLESDHVATKADTENDYWGFYFADALSLTDSLTLELAGRYNRAEIEIKDKSGFEPKLNGKHSFERFNPAVGMSYRFGEAVTLFASYHEANRAPTPAELSCADEDDPCRFPNAFLSDPPLKQVINRTIEFGGRGNLVNADHDISWQAAIYGGENRDDIAFIGGKTVGTGYFKNIGKTRRVGAELGVNGYDAEGWDWGLAYSFVKATFESAFKVDYANHPSGELGADVRKGNDIPSIPQHQIKGRFGYMLSDSWRVGVNASYTGSQYYRGDEANLLGRLDGYWLANAESSYAFNELLTAFIRVNNVFNHKYENFGLLGDASEVFEDDNALTDNNRFVSPGQPLTVLGGITITF